MTGRPGEGRGRGGQGLAGAGPEAGLPRAGRMLEVLVLKVSERRPGRALALSHRSAALVGTPATGPAPGVSDETRTPNYT